MKNSHTKNNISDMNIQQKRIFGYCVLLAGIVMAPLLPFTGLMIIPLLVTWCGMPIMALIFAVLLDSFLVPNGVAPLWVSLTFYTVLILLVYGYSRYTTS